MSNLADAPGQAVGWGLVGASSFADEVMVGAIRDAGGEVRSVFSTSAERGAEFADRHRVPASVTSLGAVLADPQVDAVYVSTTNELHRDQVMAAAAAGKHVLCEKPMATTLDDARAMRDACERAGVVLGVNHHMRLQDTVRRMRELVREGAIGDVLSARSAHTGQLVEHRRTWRTSRPEAGAGVVLDLTVHDVDTLRFLLDDEVTTVTAFTASQGVADEGIDDAVVGAMRTRRGTLVAFHDAFTLPHTGTTIELHGTEGSLIGRDLYGPTPDGDVLIRRDGVEAPVEVADRRDPYVRGLEAFHDALRGVAEPAVGAGDGIASLAVALAVLQSAATGCSAEVPVS